jgi:hypothetical protein
LVDISQRLVQLFQITIIDDIQTIPHMLDFIWIEYKANFNIILDTSDSLLVYKLHWGNSRYTGKIAVTLGE